MEITTFAIISIFLFLLLLIHIFGKSRGFGMFFGLMLLSTGVLILIDGVEYKSGEIKVLNETANPNYSNITNTYTNLKDTYPNQNIGLGVGALLFGLYAIINAVLSSKLLND